MLKFWGRSRQENSAGYKFPTTEKWFKKAEGHTPVSGRDYEWVWEYARMRFSAAEQARRQVEDKSLMTLKFVSIMGAGAWAVLAFIVSRGGAFSWWVKAPAVVGCLCLLAAGFLALFAYRPAEHVLPVDEEAAVDCVETQPTKDQAICKFCLGFAASTAREFDLVSEKGRLLKWALWALSLSVTGFILSLLFALFR